MTEIRQIRDESFLKSYPQMDPVDKTVKVLIADNQFLITESLKIIFEKELKYEVVNVVHEKSELFLNLSNNEISLLVIDPFMLDLTDSSDLKELSESVRSTSILLITNSLTKIELNKFISSGIQNIVLKTAGKEEILNAAVSAIRGRKYFSEEILDLLLEPTQTMKSGKFSPKLTKSETEIVKLICEGMTTKEIASCRNISFHTVITHRKNIFRKLGVASISELIKYAIKNGIVDLIEYNI